MIIALSSSKRKILINMVYIRKKNNNKNKEKARVVAWEAYLIKFDLKKFANDKDAPEYFNGSYYHRGGASSRLDLEPDRLWPQESLSDTCPPVRVRSSAPSPLSSAAASWAASGAGLGSAASSGVGVPLPSSACELSSFCREPSVEDAPLMEAVDMSSRKSKLEIASRSFSP